MNEMGARNTDIAYEEIKRQIFKGALRPGQSLTEEVLSASLNMSRTPVREALIRLESEGLVQTVNGRGSFVSNITPVDIVEIYQLRLLIEPFAARMCVGRVDEGRIREIRDIAAGLVEYEDRLNNSLESAISFYESYPIEELHHVIMYSVGNKRLIKVLEMLQSQIKWMLTVAGSIPGRLMRSIREHVLIADAILASDPQQAEKVMREHLQTNMHDILQIENYWYIYGSHMVETFRRN